MKTTDMTDAQKMAHLGDIGQMGCDMLAKCIRWATDELDREVLMAEQARRAAL